MDIQGSILEALGVNLYSSIGKCLVEFAANAYDSDSPGIEITIPFNQIAEAREKVRKDYKAKANPQSKVRVILDPLPEHIKIVIKDKGHGMSPENIQDKFLPLNRNRRLNNGMQPEPTLNMSESGRRPVMGRKGLGKLAAFGMALKVKIKSKRSGQTYATEFEMDFEELKNKRLHKAKFPAKYSDALSADEHWTEITLSQLRCDAVSASKEAILESLRDNFFGVDSAEFKILVNEEVPPPENASYEFYYPDHRPLEGFAEETITVPELGSFKIRHQTMFRALSAEGKRTHLSSAKRGARIYCRKRLAAGPSLLNLHSGVHNFGATAYLECVVHADELDDLGVDLINTNRTDFRRDNDVVNGLLDKITEIMDLALKAYSKFRDVQAEKELKESKFGQELEQQLSVLPKKSATAARNLLRTLAKDAGVESEKFREVAPLLITSVNTGDVLVRLLTLSTDVKTLSEVITALEKLAVIERSDALKIFRARIAAIIALQKLIKKGDETWKKGANFEKELQSLLSQNSWLISDEFGRYVTSDNQMATLLQRLEVDLKINRSAPVGQPGDNRRPDLTFLLGDKVTTTNIIVVELKSPNVPLNSDHWSQLESYIDRVERFLQSENLPSCTVTGYLIGTPPEASTQNQQELLFLKQQKKHQDQIKPIALQRLLDKALTSYEEMLKVLEHEDEES